ncbi:serine/threonine-protein kinase [Spirosoma daeguense]
MDKPERIASYTLKHEIGKGGMSKVYFAVNSINDPFAVKILNIDLAQNENIRRRFRNEMEALKSLRDIEQVCQIKDYYEDNHQMAIVMEYLTGINLLSHIKRNGPASTELLIDWLRQLLPPFAICHNRKIVHRDVKPSNFLLTTDGKIKILDFGIAKALNQNDEQLNSMSLGLTSIQEVLGSPMYMSPEQVRGLQEIDHRSDIYSLGVMMYTLLIGNNPYEGLSTRSYFDIQESIVKKPLPPLSGEAAVFNPIIQKSTRKEPIDRHQSIQEMLDEVNAIAIRRNDQPKPTISEEQPTVAIIRPSVIVPLPTEKPDPHQVTPEQPSARPLAVVTKPDVAVYPQPATPSPRVSAKKQPAPQTKPIPAPAPKAPQPAPSNTPTATPWFLIGLGILLLMAVIAIIFIDQNDAPKENAAATFERATSALTTTSSSNSSKLSLLRTTRLLSRLYQIPRENQPAVFKSARRTLTELKATPGNEHTIDSLFRAFESNGAQSELSYHKTGSASARQTAIEWYQTAYTLKANPALLQSIQGLHAPSVKTQPTPRWSKPKPAKKSSDSRSVDFIEF